MDIHVWSDYVCPWCYLGLDRARHIRDRHGADVTWLAFDLHPEIPAEGTTAQELLGPRYDAGYHRSVGARLRELFDETDLPFAPSDRIPRTRLALEAGEWVRVHASEAFDAFHEGVFTACWAEGRDIGDEMVILAVADEAGIDMAALAAGLQDVAPSAAVDAATRAGVDLGVTGTPSWLFDGRFLLPGTQPRDALDGIIERMSRAS